MSDLEKLLPEENIFAVTGGKMKGQTVAVEPLKFGKFAKALSLMAPVTAEMSGGEINVTRMMERHPETALNLITLMCGKSREWVNELEQDDGIALAGLCIKVNADFFIQKSLPAVTLLLSNLGGKLKSLETQTSPTPETTSAEGGGTSSLF